MSFATERLTIGRIGRADAGFMLALLNDPGFVTNIGDRGVRTIERAERYIVERIDASWAAHGFGMLKVLLRAGRMARAGDVAIG